MSLTDEIKDFALAIGYDRVGIASVEDFTFYKEQVTARLDMYDWAVEGSLKILSGVSPTTTMPSARSIIVTVTDVFKEAFPESLVGKIGRIYMARAFLCPPHVVHSIRANQMRDFLQQKGCETKRGGGIPFRQAAARAGVATFGRNNFAFAEGIGSYIAISAFIVDAELDYDTPTFEAPCPEDCRRCIDCCPTGALYEPFRMEPRRCIAYNSYAVTGPAYGEVPQALSLKMREQMGSWIYGCDVCQDVCPRNQRRLKAKLPVNEYLARMAPHFALTTLLDMSEAHFNERVLALLYYIKQKKYLQRNATVALGNLGDREAVVALADALSDVEPIVRGHAAWALGKLGGEEARRALEAAIRRETAIEARSEIENALSGC